ncbi:unnamed protein product [Victoria cruziana]
MRDDGTAAATFKLFGQTIHHRHHRPSAAACISSSGEARPQVHIPTPGSTIAGAAATGYQKEATSGRGEPIESDKEAGPSSSLPNATRDGKKPASGAAEGDAEWKRIAPKDKSGVDRTAKCPRCDSSDTKFCYFNNYNANQPRHFCRRCQRFWTNGGNQRNLPVGSGRRKRKPKAAGVTVDQGAELLDGFLRGQSLPSSPSSSVPSGSWGHGMEELNLGEVNQEAFSGLLAWSHGGHPPAYHYFDGESCNGSVSSGSKSGS